MNRIGPARAIGLVTLGGKVAFVGRANHRWEVRGPRRLASASQPLLAVVATDDVDVTASNDRLFFHSAGSFYKSDGTAAGTRLVYRRRPAAA